MPTLGPTVIPHAVVTDWSLVPLRLSIPVPDKPLAFIGNPRRVTTGKALSVLPRIFDNEV
jgi:hypothetical protein